MNEPTIEEKEDNNKQQQEQRSSSAIAESNNDSPSIGSGGILNNAAALLFQEKTSDTNSIPSDEIAKEVIHRMSVFVKEGHDNLESKIQEHTIQASKVTRRALKWFTAIFIILTLIASAVKAIFTEI